jgi:phage terminase small subunit
MFVSEFIACGNATAAAKRAGYSERTAKEQGYDLLTRPHIAEAIAAKQTKHFAKQDITAERILAELARIAFLDVSKLLHDDGAMKAISEIDDDTRAGIAGLEVVNLTEDGASIGTLKKIKIADKLVALDKLARNFGLLQDKLKISGDPENPIELLIRRINGQGSSIRPVVEGE